MFETFIESVLDVEGLLLMHLVVGFPEYYVCYWVR
jgi:hypothetical protein